MRVKTLGFSICDPKLCFIIYLVFEINVGLHFNSDEFTFIRYVKSVGGYSKGILLLLDDGHGFGKSVFMIDKTDLCRAVVVSFIRGNPERICVRRHRLGRHLGDPVCISRNLDCHIYIAPDIYAYFILL